MHDSFEDSLRDLLNQPRPHDDAACLERVLKTANRQVGLGDLFALIGNWFKVLLIVCDSRASSTAHVSRRAAVSPTNDET